MKKLLPLLGILLYGASASAQAFIPVNMPGQTSTFSTNARGFWFTAPTCFTITAAMVPTDASSGTQSIAIVRFETTPPTFSTTTNNFDVLYLTQNNPDPDTIPLNLIINQGDVIGVLAVRNNVNSYTASGPYAADINGLPITLQRLGMQFPLATTAPTQLWTEPSSSNFSRCFLYYDTLVNYAITYSNTGADYTFADGSDTLYTNSYPVWSYGDGSPLDSTYNPTHTYPSNGIYSVCSYITTACGTDTVCSSVTVCAYNPVAGFTNSSTGGLSVNFTDASSDADNWFWDFGDGNTATTQNPSHTYAGIGWYYVMQVVGNSCFPNDTIYDSVFVCSAPMATFDLSSTGPGQISVSDTSVFGTSTYWDFGDGDTSTAQNTTHTYASNGTYTVCLISENACGSDTLCSTITVCPDAATAAFTATNSVFTGNFTNGSTNFTSVLWDFGDGNTSASTSPSHTYSSAGTYYVCLTAYDLCGDSTEFCDSVTIAGDAGLNDPLVIQQLTIFPNPSSGNTTIQFTLAEPMQGNLRITDLTGKEVMIVYSGLLPAGVNTYPVNTGSWAAGAYLMVLETEKGKQSMRLLVK